MNKWQGRTPEKSGGRSAVKVSWAVPSINRLQAAMSHYRAGRLAEAKQLCAEVAAQEPDNVAALDMLGVLLLQEGDARGAIEAHEKTIAVRPDIAEAHNNLGNAFMGLGSAEQAVAAFRTAVGLKPGLVQAHNNLGNALKSLGKLDEALAAYRTAIGLRPDYVEAHYNLANALKSLGRLSEALAAFRTALELKPDFAGAHSDLLLCLHYDARSSQQEIFDESRRWDAVHAAPRAAPERSHPNSREPDRRLRVGYVSPDFRTHSVSYFLDPVIAGHDRRSFEVFCYADVGKPDDRTAHFRRLADGWRSTVGMTDAAVADRIREDGIDILVDLAGHTANHRLFVFAARPAPVQVTWLGYPNTTGLSAIDYRLTDAIADPEGDADALHSEKLVRLPHGFLCFTPPDDAPTPDALPALANGYVTFGSFNNIAKMTPEVVESWARVLHAVPRSRLVLKFGKRGDDNARSQCLDAFAAHGVDTGRVEVNFWMESPSHHLGAYNRVDIGLDPFPYNGATTTCEALWMGVPVIALRGERHSGRVGASLLSRVGLAALVAETKTGYVDKAVELANDPGRLSALRAGLRSRMRTSPLCDADRFARDIEAAYREMWRRWCIDNPAKLETAPM